MEQRPMEAVYPEPVLKPGENCWRLTSVQRAGFLVDGASYFEAFRDAALRARHTVFVLGWDIDSRTRLTPEKPTDRWPEALGPFLNALAESRPDLHIYVLSWDYAFIYLLDREWLSSFKRWHTHPRVHFHMDDRHPPGGSHHQKIVVVDDAVAFVGGLDLTRVRWDTPEHWPRDPRRLTPGNRPYGPYHDLQMVVDGETARSLGVLARRRWYAATGQQVPPMTTPDHDPWPDSVQAEINDTRVAIARTEPGYRGRPAVREIEQLYLDAIARARSYIYIENQYFTSETIAAALAARLEEPEGPEVILVSPHHTRGWIATHTMDVLRARLLVRLRARDRYGRFGAYYADVAGLGKEVLNVHSKLMIVDDRLVIVGSANLNNRSMGLDSECNLAVEAVDNRQVRQAARDLCNRLLGEHLGTPAKTVEAHRVRQSSLVKTVEALRGKRRTLRPLSDPPKAWMELLDSNVIDPDRPLVPSLASFRLADEAIRHKRLLLWALLLLILVGLGLAWRWTPLQEWADLEVIAAQLTRIREAPWAPFWVVAGYAVAGLIAAPVTALIVATVLTFGMLQGILYALAGSLVSALVTFGLGHMLGHDTVRRMAGGRIHALSERLAERGVLAVALVRILPLAPFSIVNIVAGASHIRLRDFILGTLLGMTPGILAIAVFIDRIAAAIIEPDPSDIALAALALALLLTAAFVLRRWLTRHRSGNENLY